MISVSPPPHHGWKLKFVFDNHLAEHLINAMKAIHDYMLQGWIPADNMGLPIYRLLKVSSTIFHF